MNITTSAQGRVTAVDLRGRLVCKTDDEATTVAQELPRHIELTRAEPGCLQFVIEQTADPLVWSVSERFANHEAFEAHQERVRVSDWGLATIGIERDYVIAKVPEDRDRNHQLRLAEDPARNDDLDIEFEPARIELHDRRLRIASDALEFIENEIRPFLATGGRLWSKGSRGYPARLRTLLEKLDVAREVTYATEDSMRLPREKRVIEHVIPMKRIVIEIVDPRQADPRSNTSHAPIAGGPARSPQHLIEIFDRLVQKCWVTSEEHDRLNRAGRSYQWDAPEGDGWARYREAGVNARPLVEGRILEGE